MSVEIKCPHCFRTMSTAPGSVNRCDAAVCAFARLQFGERPVISEHVFDRIGRVAADQENPEPFYVSAAEWDDLVNDPRVGPYLQPDAAPGRIRIWGAPILWKPLGR